MYGISKLGIIPMRKEPNHRSEQVSQLLFGECFKIEEQQQDWAFITVEQDGYQGWIDYKQIECISEEMYKKLIETPQSYNADMIGFVSDRNHLSYPIPLGASLSFLKIKELNQDKIKFEGMQTSGKKTKKDIIQTALMYLNTPYLWGGKTPSGIDCSGFVQMVYRLNGYDLYRDAYQQATQGEALSFIEESELGDLAFFDNEEGRIIHVGIILSENKIIHAHGKVRIDNLDYLGVLNTHTKRHTHKLRLIKRMF